MAADPENTLVIETTKGRVVIELRPDLAPKHVERIKQLAREGFYDGIVVPSRHRRLHGADRLPQGHRHRRLELSEPQGRVQCRAARARHLLDGALAEPRQRQQPVLHRASTTRRFLDKQYTVWGKVIEGMENVDKIKRGEPVSNPDKMVSVKVGG